MEHGFNAATFLCHRENNLIEVWNVSNVNLQRSYMYSAQFVTLFQLYGTYFLSHTATKTTTVHSIADRKIAMTITTTKGTKHNTHACSVDTVIVLTHSRRRHDATIDRMVASRIASRRRFHSSSRMQCEINNCQPAHDGCCRIWYEIWHWTYCCTKRISSYCY